jgi:hypothetical protein
MTQVIAASFNSHLEIETLYSKSMVSFQDIHYWLQFFKDVLKAISFKVLIFPKYFHSMAIQYIRQYHVKLKRSWK